jgi:hypothetical protein
MHSTPSYLLPLPLQMARFFCGMAPVCANNSRETLRLALLHLEHEYVAVGLLERHVESMRLFKKMLPRFFSAYVESPDSTVSGDVSSELLAELPVLALICRSLWRRGQRYSRGVVHIG